MSCAQISAQVRKSATTMPFVSTTQLCNYHIAVGQYLQQLRSARGQPSGREVDDVKLFLYADRPERLSSPTNEMALMTSHGIAVARHDKPMSGHVPAHAQPTFPLQRERGTAPCGRYCGGAHSSIAFRVSSCIDS